MPVIPGKRPHLLPSQRKKNNAPLRQPNDLPGGTGNIRHHHPPIPHLRNPNPPTQHHQPHPGTGGGIDRVRRDPRRERMRSVHQHIDRLPAQVVDQPVDPAEPADPKLASRQHRPGSPAAQRRDHLVTTLRVQCVGKRPGLRRSTQDQYPHVSRPYGERQHMREILVIGIGAGNPEYITVQAINALNAADVFFVIDKGEDKSSLLALRTEICDRYRTDPGYRLVQIPEPDRDRAATAYTEAVEDWHERRAERIEAAIVEHLPGNGRGAFLVWGDPALYDSTLRVIDRVLARGNVEFEHRVIPGITAVQALAAQHRLPLNRIGEPVHITTGRRLAHGLPDGLDSAVIMLDPAFAAADLADPDLHIYWGAYLGTPDEELRSGRLRDVVEEISELKQQLRARHGWIMDTYLIRREPS